MTNQRVAFFIDGSNLYHKLKNLNVQHTSEFDYLGFCHKLARGRQIVYLGYYIGIVRVKNNNFKGQILRKEQQKLLNSLQNNNFLIKQGYLLETNGKYHEKGVEVQIATDILIGAYDNTYDTAILISSDTDLIPAIKKTINLGKGVEYIGFYYQPSFGVQKKRLTFIFIT